MITSRRSFLTGLGAALIVAPAIVRAGSLMPVKQMLIVGDGVALQAITHPHMIPIGIGMGDLVWRDVDKLKKVTAGNIDGFTRILGIVIGPSAQEQGFFYGDIVMEVA